MYTYPLPVADPARPQPPAPVSHILHCTAPRARLRFGEQVKNSSCVAFYLHDHQHRMGTINPHTEPEESICQSGSECELIALSEAEVLEPRRMVNWGWPGIVFDKHSKAYRCRQYLDEEPMFMGKKAFYNVMWIEWIGDMAERRGLGIVRKEVWDARHPRSHHIQTRVTKRNITTTLAESIFTTKSAASSYQSRVTSRTPPSTTIIYKPNLHADLNLTTSSSRPILSQQVPSTELPITTIPFSLPLPQPPTTAQKPMKRKSHQKLCHRQPT
jgi:hypothetical protein